MNELIHLWQSIVHILQSTVAILDLIVVTYGHWWI